MKGLFLVLTLAFLGSSAAKAVTCEAKVALNAKYKVEVDDRSRWMTVTNNFGDSWDGTASYYMRGRSIHTYYYLPVDFGRGIKLMVEEGFVNNYALCLAQNECYLCK